MPVIEHIHKQGEIYETEEERLMGRRAANLRYAQQPYTCYLCKLTIRRGNKWNHEKSENHVNHLKNSTV